MAAECDDASLTFRLDDPDHHLAAVRLFQHAGVDRLDFRREHDAWCLRVDRPRLHRLEYLLELRHHDGRTELICDPGNPRRVGGAYGDKSVLECPGYVPPGWLDHPCADGSWRDLTIRSPALRADVTARVWSPAAQTELVLVANDGPEYENFGGLAHYSAALQRTGSLPPFHLVLLAPGDRSEWYSANPAYAWAFVADLLPRIYAVLGTRAPVVGIGASLGGLAMLHAQRRYPAAFAGLYLQSTSFFRPHLDHQESGFRRWLRIVRFTGRVVRAVDGPAVPTVLTCGAVEENLANNRELADALGRHGYDVTLVENQDAHNYTGWRDTFDPHLTGLLSRVWAR